MGPLHINCNINFRWGWLAFNCGSTFGISGGKWILSAKSATTTLLASMSGGFVGIVISFLWNDRKIMVPDIINSVLGSLVGITASCAVVRAWESIIIGAIGTVLYLFIFTFQFHFPVSCFMFFIYNV